MGDKCKRLAGRRRWPSRVFVLDLRGCVQIRGQNLFAKCVRIGKCSNQRVFESRTTVQYLSRSLNVTG